MRTCPAHPGAEVLFRPNPEPLLPGQFESTPWCTWWPHRHAIRVWRVTDQHGRIWASATRTKVKPWLLDFDVLFAELVSKDEKREVAASATGTPMQQEFVAPKVIAAWSYKRRQRAEAVA